jgi:3-methylcrotonyl-CoA carboxylase beta subunit
VQKIETDSNTRDKQFGQRVEIMKKMVADLNLRLAELPGGGREKAVAKHRQRGKLTARERIELLLDAGTPFLELSALAAYGQYDNQFPSAGIVTGIGVIHDRDVIIVSNAATVNGGTYVHETIKKHLRAQEIAMQNHLPCIYLVDSGGIFLPEQARVFPDKEDFGRIFYNQAQLSAQGIPQIAVVMGSCTAGGAYVPAMSDETIIVRNQGTIFIGGPPLVKAATGEEVSAEELGGGHVHTHISGVADHLAENDEHALELCRSIIETLPEPEKMSLDIHSSEEPARQIKNIYGTLPVNEKYNPEVRELIAHIVDNSEWHEFKSDYAPTIRTGFARIMGYPAGIIANNGVIYAETARKTAHFIQLCEFRKIPIVFLQNITGFIVGKKHEHAGIARDGAKMIHAVANANVPKFTIITGGSYGAGNYAMAGRAFNPHFLWMYPNAKIGVMGGKQAAEVLTSIQTATANKNGQSTDEKNSKATFDKIRDQYEHESSAFYSTSRLWDDGIIDPADTRRYLAMGIAISRNRLWNEPKHGVFRM